MQTDPFGGGGRAAWALCCSVHGPSCGHLCDGEGARCALHIRGAFRHEPERVRRVCESVVVDSQMTCDTTALGF
eukprot:8940441-Pyramimonas_sp.AAC.3